MNKLAIFVPMTQMNAMTPVMQAVTALTDPGAAGSVTAFDWFALSLTTDPNPTWESAPTHRAGDFSAATDLERAVIDANATPGCVIVVLGPGLTFAQAAAQIGLYRVPDEEV